LSPASPRCRQDLEGVHHGGPREPAGTQRPLADVGADVDDVSAAVLPDDRQQLPLASGGCGEAAVAVEVQVRARDAPHGADDRMPAVPGDEMYRALVNAISRAHRAQEASAPLAWLR
jgi:hypothetical protein